MRATGVLLSLSVAMAVIKAMVLALLVVFGIGLLMATVEHPAATIGFMLMMATVSLVEAHPWAAGAGLIATAIAAATSRSDNSAS